ncbi:hypothetical protein TRVL_05552 [Trypanosoma vivax]|nr:hypothetical protein TRVL_05552 [Trypanosoma vivax]
MCVCSFSVCAVSLVSLSASSIAIYFFLCASSALFCLPLSCVPVFWNAKADRAATKSSVPLCWLVCSLLLSVTRACFSVSVDVACLFPGCVSLPECVVWCHVRLFLLTFFCVGGVAAGCVLCACPSLRRIDASHYSTCVHLSLFWRFLRVLCALFALLVVMCADQRLQLFCVVLRACTRFYCCTRSRVVPCGARCALCCVCVRGLFFMWPVPVRACSPPYLPSSRRVSLVVFLLHTCM